MIDISTPFVAEQAPVVAARHPRWVRISHLLVTISFFALLFSGYEILMVHPRLYWGNAGNDLTPALFELPVSRNYRHQGWQPRQSFQNTVSSAVSASRTYEIFNQNGWGRSLHFLSGWILVLTGLCYLLAGFITGHFKESLWPAATERKPRLLAKDMLRHFTKMPALADGAAYGLLQKCTYLAVIFL
ncbi:MAG TPA: cytochrome b/b6 domain-containing protein, partial [Chitinophagaceae bacterium]|nr:cytochrome b/b6 domain-containing protein [Chitinophagaceae bacterium]